MKGEDVLEKNIEYMEGLKSAQIVQAGLLPKERHFKRLFKHSFVSYLPKDIVSGDFFWVGGKHKLRYLVVGDCTGHGISAALLSVLALNLLEYVVMNKGIKKASKILKEVDKKFIESFKQSNKDNFDNPWIDLSLACIDDVAGKIYFSSANRKMLFVDKDKNMRLYKGSKYPIGGWQISDERKFKSEVVSFKPGDCIYLGTDGFQDQIGGEREKKFKSKNLHEILANNSQLKFKEQKELLQNEFISWKKDNFQTDDICIVGVKL